MATVLKVLGQSFPAQSELTTLYRVPERFQTVSSSIIVCNTSEESTYFRIAVRPLGEDIDMKHYIYYDVEITGNDTFIATIGLTLSETDEISVYSRNGSLSFSIYGQENR